MLKRVSYLRRMTELINTSVGLTAADSFPLFFLASGCMIEGFLEVRLRIQPGIVFSTSSI